MWVEVKLSAYSAILVGYVHRNPAVTYAWYDDFVEMMDTVNESNSIIVLLGDFKIGLLKSQPAWESTISLFGLHQHITLCNKNNSISSYSFHKSLYHASNCLAYLNSAGIIIIIIIPLTARVVGAPQMILQLVFSIFPCRLGLAELQACPFPDVFFPPLPLSALSSSPFHCALQDGFGQT